MTTKLLTEAEITDIVQYNNNRYMHSQATFEDPHQRISNLELNIERLVDHIAELNKRDEWIKCSEWMPTSENAYVLVWHDGMNRPRMDMLWPDGEWIDCPGAKYTHWRPLPEGPK